MKVVVDKPISSSSSTSSPSAQNSQQAVLCARAHDIFNKGNKADKDFAKTLTKSIRSLSKRKKIGALAACEELEDTAISRRQIRARVESIVSEERKSKEVVIESWRVAYSSKVPKKNVHQLNRPPALKRVSFHVE